MREVPAPFLGPLFEEKVEPIISTGFNYHQAEIDLHGVTFHSAIDFDLPRGTKIFAPADGYYLSTYGEVLLKDAEGNPRQLTLSDAKKGNPRNIHLSAPKGGDKNIYFGSFVVQGWHTKGRYTQFAHVDWVSPKIPYHPPIVLKDDNGEPMGNLIHSPALRSTVNKYRDPSLAVFIKKGELIAEVGMTGCGWGQPCYSFLDNELNQRPDFRGVDYTYYTSPHLHFMVFGNRTPKKRRPIQFFDPFGIYGDLSAGYPKSIKNWKFAQPGSEHKPLWL